MIKKLLLRALVVGVVIVILVWKGGVILPLWLEIISLLGVGSYLYYTILELYVTVLPNPPKTPGR